MAIRVLAASRESIDSPADIVNFSRSETSCSSTKAALRLGGMALAAEAEVGIGGTGRDLAVVSYEPGLVDTDMQAENRAASPEDFPDSTTFAALLDRDDLPPFSELRREP